MHSKNRPDTRLGNNSGWTKSSLGVHVKGDFGVMYLLININILGKNWSCYIKPSALIKPTDGPDQPRHFPSLISLHIVFRSVVYMPTVKTSHAGQSPKLICLPWANWPNHLFGSAHLPLHPLHIANPLGTLGGEFEVGLKLPSAGPGVLEENNA